MQDRTEKFLELYKELEFFGRNTYFPEMPDSENIIGRLLTLPQLVKYKEELNYCRVVRNFLVHNPKVGGSYAIEPSQEMIDFLSSLTSLILVPLKAIDVCTKRKNMLCATTEDNVFAILTKMRERNYTHVPIYQKNIFLGIFSEQTMCSFMLHNLELEVDMNTKFEYFRNVIDFSREIQNSQYVFFAEDTAFAQVKKVFEENYKIGRPYSAGFVTQTGKWTEEILGILTPNDIIEEF